MKNIPRHSSWSFKHLIIMGLYVPMVIRVPFFNYRTTTPAAVTISEFIKYSRYININSFV